MSFRGVFTILNDIYEGDSCRNREYVIAVSRKGAPSQIFDEALDTHLGIVFRKLLQNKWY